MDDLPEYWSVRNLLTAQVWRNEATRRWLNLVPHGRVGPWEDALRWVAANDVIALEDAAERAMQTSKIQDLVVRMRVNAAEQTPVRIIMAHIRCTVCKHRCGLVYMLYTPVF